VGGGGKVGEIEGEASGDERRGGSLLGRHERSRDGVTRNLT
jgi:hypothetical protein